MHRLERAGHRVTYGSPRLIEDLATTNGINYLQLPPVNFFPGGQDHGGGSFKQRLQKWWLQLLNRKERQAQAVQALGMDEFAVLLNDENPDLLIVDIELHEHLMTAIAKGVPTILLSQWFSLWQRPGLPPLMQDTIPGQTWEGSRLGLTVAWWRWRWQRRWMFGKKRLRSAGTNRRAIIQKYAHKVGFPLHYARQNYWPGPFTYSGLPVISMTMEEIEFPHPVQPGLTYVGALINDQRSGAKEDAEIEHQLQAIFAAKEQQQARLICCTVSTFKAGDTYFLQRLVTAVGRRPEWLLVIGLGAKVEVQELGELPANVFPFNWIPQLKVLAKADCSINHGGIHTINECIHYQVPMLVYSGKRSDQNGCAARVHYHQLGIMADKDEDDSATIEMKIQKVLESSVYRQQMQQIHEYYLRYSEDEILIRYIENFLTNT